MKTSAVATLLSLTLSGVSGFAVLPTATPSSSTALSGAIAVEDMSATQKEILQIQEKWSEVRFMSSEEAEGLEPEWKEAYDRFHEKYESDMVRMTEICDKLERMIEPPKVEKKTEGQRRRDKWAKVQAREAARAALK